MNPTPGFAPRQADAMMDRPRSRLHRRIPDGIEKVLDGECYKFFSHVVHRARFGGWSDDTSQQLADDTGLARSTVERHLATLRRHGLIGTTDDGRFPRVNGRRRLYPVDQRGNETIPPELKTARPPSEARKSCGSGAGASAPTKGDSRASLSSTDEKTEPGAAKTERQRPDDPGATDARIAHPKLYPPQLPGPSRGAVELAGPVEPAAAVVEPQAAEPQRREITPQPIEDLADGQRDFMSRLTPEQRARLDGLPPAERRKMLEPFGRGFDAVIAAEYTKRLTSRQKTADAIAVPPPASTPELIARLPGGCATWVQTLAERLVLDFDDRKRWRCWERVARAVRVGTLDAGNLANAYRQAMKPGIRTRGAKCWAALRGLAGIDWPALERMAAPGKSMR